MQEPTIETEFYFQWHLTERCNQRCSHCYHEEYDSNRELNSDELCYAFKKIEQFTKALDKRAAISLTGGEPWLKSSDVLLLLDKMQKSDVVDRVDILTNGSLFTEDDCKKLAQIPVLRRIQVSLEAASALENDSIRGEGSFDRTCQVIERMKRHGLKVAVMMTISKKNFTQIMPMLELLKKLKVDTFALERFMPVGQSEEWAKWILSPEELQQAFQEAHSWAMKNNEPRVLMYRPLYCLIDPEDNTVGAMCSVGGNALTIMHDGQLLPCRRLPMHLGNIMTDNLLEIWYESPILWKARNPRLIGGRCGTCEHIAKCRGCRATALAAKGDWLAEDPHCWKPVTEPTPVVARLNEHVRLVNPQFSNQYFAYRSDNGLVMELNEESYAVMQQIDGRNTWKEIEDNIAPRYSNSSDVQSAITTLQDTLQKESFMA